MKVILLHASALIAFAVAGSAIAAGDPLVGGARMYDNKNIIENAVNSKDHTTLVAAVKAAGLADTLQGPGPLTVFAPTNAAFAALPAQVQGRRRRLPVRRPTAVTLAQRSAASQRTAGPARCWRSNGTPAGRIAASVSADFDRDGRRRGIRPSFYWRLRYNFRSPLAYGNPSLIAGVEHEVGEP